MSLDQSVFTICSSIKFLFDFHSRRTRSSHWFPPPEFWVSKLGLPYGWEAALDHQRKKYYIKYVCINWKAICNLNCRFMLYFRKRQVYVDIYSCVNIVAFYTGKRRFKPRQIYCFAARSIVVLITLALDLSRRTP